MFPLSPPAPQKRLLHRDPPDQHTSHWLWLGWRGCCRLEEPVFSGQLNPSSASRSPNRFPGGWKGHCVPFHVGSDTGGESGASWGGETRPKSAKFMSVRINCFQTPVIDILTSSHKSQMCLMVSRIVNPFQKFSVDFAQLLWKNCYLCQQ